MNEGSAPRYEPIAVSSESTVVAELIGDDVLGDRLGGLLGRVGELEHQVALADLGRDRDGVAQQHDDQFSGVGAAVWAESDFFLRPRVEAGGAQAATVSAVAPIDAST